MASSLLRSSARVRVPSSSRPLCLRRPNMAARCEGKACWLAHMPRAEANGPTLPPRRPRPRKSTVHRASTLPCAQHRTLCKYIALRSAPYTVQVHCLALSTVHRASTLPGAQHLQTPNGERLHPRRTTTGSPGPPAPPLVPPPFRSLVVRYQALCLLGSFVVCHRRPFSALPSPPPLLPELAASHSEEQASAIGKARCADLDEWAAASGSRGLAVLDALAGARCVVDSLVGPPVSPRQRPPPDETPQTNGWHGRVQATSEQSGNDMCLRTTGRGVHHSSVRVQHRQFACSLPHVHEAAQGRWHLPSRCCGRP
ncbi:hypothetical protein RJ55_06787 [Drechmeria coniospora]|nr:hypothetical protein RJ55_06787 [Drechmeria coniospora]